VINESEIGVFVENNNCIETNWRWNILFTNWTRR